MTAPGRLGQQVKPLEQSARLGLHCGHVSSASEACQSVLLNRSMEVTRGLNRGDERLADLTAVTLNARRQGEQTIRRAYR